MLSTIMLSVLFPAAAVSAEVVRNIVATTSEPGIVAIMQVASDATLEQNKVMEQSSQWSTDGLEWKNTPLTPTVVQDAQSEKIYIYTPLSGMNSSYTTVLPNIKADVTVSIDPTITNAGSYFMSCYAADCTALTSLSVPDTSKIETVGDYFMSYYAAGCTALTSLKAPDTSELTAVGNRFMSDYANGYTALTSLEAPDTSKLITIDNYFMSYYALSCVALTSLDVPNTSKATTVGDYFMSDYANGCTVLTSLEVPDTSELTTIDDCFMSGYAAYCSALTSLEVPDTSKIETAGDYFMSYYASGCTKLLRLNAAGAPGWFVNNDVSWGIFAEIGGKITFAAPDSTMAEAWYALTGNGKTLALNNITSGTHELSGEKIQPHTGGTPNYTVTVTGGGGSGQYEEGTTVTITANTPPSRQRFKEWRVISGVTLVNKTANPTTFAMPQNDVQLEAVFEDLPYSVVFTQNGTTPSAAVSYDAPAGAAVIIAFYKGGKLMRMDKMSVPRKGIGGFNNISIATDADTVKVMLWNSLGTMQPLCGLDTKPIDSGTW